ncbi:carbohydrate ABC transporter permease [Spirochaeta cellobiosiphila]|uniref:carbohydrate ABC transporter permease n=1 Tax=Spirochaeta cellobiosiphila TaxID=504483 RepID=UPI00041A32BB|nr:carbohydrate ABC transporter permease [Spirochaeta cellobiosiphila]
MINKKSIGKKILIYTIVVFYGLTIFLPLIIMILTSFKSNAEIFNNPFGLPSSFNFDAYKSLFIISNYSRYFINSVAVALISLTIALILSGMASFGLAKYEFKYSKAIYFYFVLGLIVPIKLGTIDIMITMVNLKIYDTLGALIIVYTAMAIPLSIFIMYDYIKMIPEELLSAARIDGCSETKIFQLVILPLLKPGIAAAGIISFIPNWNEFWFPLVLIKSRTNFTIPLATGQLFGQFDTKINLVFAVLSLASIPVIIIYLLLSQYFQEGLSAGALKG